MPRGPKTAPTRTDASTHSFGDQRPALVAAYQHRRILIGATVAFARGYDRTTVEDIVERSGVSRRTVYELFDGKAGIFDAAHVRALVSLRDCLRGTGSSRPTQPGDVIAALLAWGAAEPSQALLVFAPALVAGPHIALARERLFVVLGPLLAVATPSRRALPLLSEGLLGGLAELISARLLTGDAATLPSLAPPLARFVLAYHRQLGNEPRR